MDERTAEQDIELLAEEGRRLADVATIDLDIPVTSCPGWTEADLLRHVGTIYRWAVGIVDSQATERQSKSGIEPPEDDDLTADWFDASLRQVLDVLDEADPTAEVWTFGSDRTVRFWSRRMLHETMMHRWDAQTARGDEEGFDADLAVDAIDEFLDLHILRPGTLAEADEILHVRAEDANADWSLDPDIPDELGRGFAEGDAHLSGPASDLLLTLWHRLDPDSVRWEGDNDAIGAWSDRLEQLRL